MSIEELKKVITQSHNPFLVINNPKVSPNENIIWHIYSNGETTYQKGSWAYRQRSEFNQEYQIPNLKLDSNLFPYKTTVYGTEIGYAVVTKENAIKIRKMMLEIVSKNENKIIDSSDRESDYYE